MLDPAALESLKSNYIAQPDIIVPEQRVLTLDEVLGNSLHNIDSRRKGKVLGYLTRWKSLNKTLGGYIPFDVTLVIAARPSVGKSAIGQQIALDIFQCNPKRKVIFLFFNFEMASYQQGTRIFSSYSGRSVHQLYSADTVLEESVWEQLHNIREEIKHFNLWFFDLPMTVNQIYETVFQVRTKYPKHRIVTMFDHTRHISPENEKNEKERIERLMQCCNVMVKRFSTTNIVISQLNREVTEFNVSSSKYRPPSLSDLFGASAVEQKAEIVILLHRPEMDNVLKYDVNYNGLTKSISTKGLMIWEIAKNRDGPINTLLFKHDLATNSLKLLNKEDLGIL